MTAALADINQEYLHWLADGDDMKALSLKQQRDSMEVKLMQLSRELKTLTDGIQTSSSSSSSSLAPITSTAFSSTSSSTSRMISQTGVSTPRLSWGEANRSSASVGMAESNIGTTTPANNFYMTDSGINHWEDMPQAIASRANCITSNPVPIAGSYSTNFGYPAEVVSDFDANNPSCHCGMPSVVRVSKQDRSMNRSFYVCSKDQADMNRCKFFQWTDEDGGSRDRSSFPSMMTTDLGAYQSPVAGSTVNPGDIKRVDEVLRRTFGHTGFRQGQRECIDAALLGRDVFCLMPTGGGKSIVYQLPAMCCRGIAVVFSPLLSLIVDQVELLSAVGIR
jgi:hypothetical protein